MYVSYVLVIYVERVSHRLLCTISLSRREYFDRSPLLFPFLSFRIGRRAFTFEAQPSPDFLVPYPSRTIDISAGRKDFVLNFFFFHPVRSLAHDLGMLHRKPKQTNPFLSSFSW